MEKRYMPLVNFLILAFTLPSRRLNIPLRSRCSSYLHTNGPLQASCNVYIGKEENMAGRNSSWALETHKGQTMEQA